MLPADSRCLGCRYPLEGVVDPRCPECGRAFDPDDESTVYVPGRHTWWQRNALRPPGPALLTAAIASAGTLILAYCEPAGSYFLCEIVGVVVGTLVILIWIVRLGIALVEASQLKCYTTHIRPNWKRWLVVPALILFAIVVSDLRVLGHLRLLAARATLEAVAQQALSPPSSWTRPTIATTPLLVVSGPFPDNGVVIFHLPSDVGWLDSALLIYVPTAKTAADIPKRVRSPRHFQGLWYVGWEKF
ncbi:MAG: hypothetical protein IT436_18135 [Phycisphaerales bacterium]|nr:hypothetical protein [Phycisphaerales bacterium]